VLSWRARLAHPRAVARVHQVGTLGNPVAVVSCVGSRAPYRLIDSALVATQDGTHLRVPGRRDLWRTAAGHRRACAASGERTHIGPARQPRRPSRLAHAASYAGGHGRICTIRLHRVRAYAPGVRRRGGGGLWMRQGSRRPGSRVCEAIHGEYARHPSNVGAPVSVAWLGGVWPGFGRGMGRGCGGGRDGDATDAGGTHLARSTLRTGATATPTFMHRDAIGS
jgi:hypothetical protein